MRDGITWSPCRQCPLSLLGFNHFSQGGWAEGSMFVTSLNVKEMKSGVISGLRVKVLHTEPQGSFLLCMFLISCVLTERKSSPGGFRPAVIPLQGLHCSLYVRYQNLQISFTFLLTLKKADIMVSNKAKDFHWTVFTFQFYSRPKWSHLVLVLCSIRGLNLVQSGWMLHGSYFQLWADYQTASYLLKAEMEKWFRLPL